MSETPNNAPVPETQTPFTPPAGMHLRPSELAAINCARCIFAMREPDIVVNSANVASCIDAHPQTARKSLAKLVDAGLAEARPLSVRMPHQGGKQKEFILTDVGRSVLQPKVQSNCRLREIGPAMPLNPEQQRVIRCVSCLTGTARARNMVGEFVGSEERELEGARPQSVAACAGVNSQDIYYMFDQFIKVGYLRKQPIDSKKDRYQSRFMFVFTDLGERRFGVAASMQCRSAEIESQRLLDRLTSTQQQVLDCVIHLAELAQQEEIDGVLGATSTLVSKCTGLQLKYTSAVLSKLTDEGYLSRAIDPSYRSASQPRYFHQPTTALSFLLKTLKTLRPQSGACYAQQLRQHQEQD